MRTAWLNFCLIVATIGAGCYGWKAASIIASSPGDNAYLSNITLLRTNAQRIDSCHAGCVTGKEQLYDTISTTPCTAGDFARHVHVMGYDGSGDIDLTTLPGLAPFVATNTGNAKFSWDGNWIIVQVLETTSALACNNVAANPGVGFDNGALICDWPAVLSCTQVVTVTVGIGAGTLHPMFNGNTTFAMWMHASGAGGFNAANIWGNLQTAAFTHPGGVPTLGGATIRCPTQGSCAGQHIGYEPAGADPFNFDNMFFTIFLPLWNQTQVYRYSISTGAAIAVSFTPAYSEFWNPDSTGSWAVSSSSLWSAVPNPPGSSGGVPQSELTISAINSGAGSTGLTTYNTPGTSMYLANSSVIAHPVWNRGQTGLCWTLVNNGINSIWCANFNRFAASISGQATLSGQVTLGTHP